MEAVNINYVEGQSNYRLLKKNAFPMMVRTESHVRVVPDGDGYRPYTEEYQWNDDNPLTRRTGVVTYRKQTAARMAKPVESVKIVRIKEIQPVEVVDAILAGKPQEDVTVAKLEAKIKVLLGLVKKT